MKLDKDGIKEEVISNISYLVKIIMEMIKKTQMIKMISHNLSKY
jgi:hypothetical protein